MRRRQFLRFLGTGAAGLAIPGALRALHAAPRKNRPNIVLCMTDDQGWGDTGYNGHPHLKTPSLDAMAREGVRFDRFYAAAPVCSPTRGTSITGRHHSRYGIDFAMDGHMRPEELTLYEALKNHGYTTGHFGKWHIGALTKEKGAQNRWGVWAKEPAKHYSPPWENGVDVCFVTESKVPTWDPMKIPEHWRGKAGARFGNDYFVGPGKIATDNLEGDDSRVMMDRAIPFIRKAVKSNKPFLAVIWFHAPHSPVVAGPKQLELYKDRPEHEAHYYGCLTAMDHQVGRLRKTLADLGVAENTMLWFCSDNGPARQGKKRHVGSNGGLRGYKLSLLEGGIRVPGLLVWPDRIKEPRRIAAPCCTSDYVPTIYAALGLDPPEQPEPVDGIDLWPVIEGKRKERGRPIAFEVRRHGAIVEDRYKAIGNLNKDKWRLYDIVADPREEHNLADEKPRALEAMKAFYRQWDASCEASRRGKDYE